MAETRWWHRWQGICPDGVLVALIPGDSPNGPEEIDTTLVVTVPTVGCFGEDCETVMAYVASWDHDPTDADIDAVVPPGYRSTDRDSEPDRCEECMDGHHSECTDVEDESCCCPPGPDRHYFSADDLAQGRAVVLTWSEPEDG